MFVLGVLLKELSEKVLTMRVIQTVEAIVSLLPPPKAPKYTRAVSGRGYFGGWGRTLLGIYQLTLAKLRVPAVLFN